MTACTAPPGCLACNVVLPLRTRTPCLQAASACSVTVPLPPLVLTSRSYVADHAPPSLVASDHNRSEALVSNSLRSLYSASSCKGCTTRCSGSSCRALLSRVSVCRQEPTALVSGPTGTLRRRWEFSFAGSVVSATVSLPGWNRKAS